MTVKSLQTIRCCGVALVLFGALLLSACQNLKPEPKPEPRYVPEVVLSESETVFIADGRVPCDSGKPMQCMLMLGQDGSRYAVPYNAIDGFEPRVGVTYQLRVRQQFDKATGQTLGRWILDEILSQR